MSIIATLPVGYENGINKDVLMGAHGLSSEREFRKEIADDRTHIGAICVKDGKYFRPGNSTEYTQWRRSRLRMAYTILKDISIQDRYFPELKQIEGQITLNEFFEQSFAEPEKTDE